MSLLRYLHLDVFTASTGGGNHLGVVIGADAWSTGQMQRFARWTALVETTFLLPPTDPAASYRVRIFTPQAEIPFAGHPSIGSAHAVLNCGIAAPKEGLLWQECGAGVLPIRIEGDGSSRELMLHSPPSRVLDHNSESRAPLEAALAGLPLGRLTPVLIDGGRRWWVAEIADEANLRTWLPDHAAIGALAKGTGSMGLCVFARSNHPAYQLVVRALPAGVGIAEDPASGAANGLIGAYIAQAEPHGTLARGYHVSQGREIGHDARLIVQIEGDSVWVGGCSHTVIDGQLDWNPPA